MCNKCRIVTRPTVLGGGGGGGRGVLLGLGTRLMLGQQIYWQPVEKVGEQNGSLGTILKSSKNFLVLEG